MTLQKGEPARGDLAEVISFENELEEEILDEWGDEDAPDDSDPEQLDFAKLRREIEDISNLIQLAHSIQTDTKSKALLKALEIGFSEQERMGARRKALIFTESRRTQDYLRDFLERNGYANRVVTFSGTNSDRRAQDTGTNTTQIATTGFVAAAIGALIDAAPGAMNTLNELAAALGDDPSFATTVTSALAGKLAAASNLSDLPSKGTARSNLGLGSMATQASSNVAITGGAINGITLDGGTF